MTVHFSSARVVPAVAAPVHLASKKRKETERDVSEVAEKTLIDTKFLKACSNEYNQNKTHEVMRNVITLVGPSLAATSDAQSRKIHHEFSNTHKVPHYASTNQSNSGRCWLFAGLNILRPFAMTKFEAKHNIEFSATYLFFHDKLERSRTYLLSVLKTLDLEDGDPYMLNLQKTVVDDGGWFEMFANLVSKYGLVPESAMPETAMSGWSSEMNDHLKIRLKTCAFILRRDKAKMDDKQRMDLVDETLKYVYNDLVKCLGKPPETFDFAFLNENDRWIRLSDLNPKQFLKICTPDIEIENVSYKFSFDDFIVLSHLPQFPYNHYYEYKVDTNVFEGRWPGSLNVNLRDFETLTCEQLKYMPVWMGCDVMRNFSAIHHAMDPELVDSNRVFDPVQELNTEERYVARTQEMTHAMTIIGAEYDPDTKLMTAFQIENSWGAADKEEPGLDGFLYMSRRSFLEDCAQVVVMKHLLPARLLNVLKQPARTIEQWQIEANCLRIPEAPPAAMIESLRKAANLRRLKA